jgi:hypothetical protein
MAKGKHPHGGGGSNTVPAPTGLMATLSGNIVGLTWNGVANAQGYWVYRNGYVPSVARSTSYVDDPLPAGTYVYEVAAVVDTVLGPKSNSVTVTI